ncbi:MAG: PUA domain-containing protein, partial [Promethearchaeota archaeon]
LLRQYIQPLENGVQHLPQIIIRDTAVDAICHGANLAVAGVIKLHSDINKGDMVAIMTLKGELVAVAKAQNNCEQILDAKSGIVAIINRVILPAGTYPSSWQKRS